MAPGGLFCMSGHVAHADDEDADYCRYIQAKSSVPFQQVPSRSKTVSSTLQATDDKEEIDNQRLSDVEFLTDQFPEYCVRFQCPDGTCKMLWSSGASYKGDMSAGNLHGVGTYTYANGAVYEGNWVSNKKHGFGKKKFANDDTYEGFWKDDKPDGQGRYIWADGSEYCGEWKNGLMSGVGILTWADGDSYDGQWLNGLADGYGVYIRADSSVYMGNWKEGSKVGECRYLSVGRNSMEARSFNIQPTTISDDTPVEVLGENVPDSRSFPIAGEASETSHGLFSTSDKTLTSMTKVTPAHFPATDVAAFKSNGKEKEYSLFLEMLRRLESSTRRRSNAFYEEREPELLGERTDDSDMASYRHEKAPGEAVGRNHRSYNLVTALQYSVQESPARHDLELSLSDFDAGSAVKINVNNGSSQFEAHCDVGEFQWTDYCPNVFRKLREMSKLLSLSYCQSICATGGLREFPSPGKSGCIFYLSQDSRFMIKTLRKAEVKTLLRMLRSYYQHIQSYRDTLLTKFFGLHALKPAGGQKVWFVVMGNVLPSEYQISRIYDLKGSSEGRTARKGETAGFAPQKDLDLNVVFQLDSYLRRKMLGQMEKDCKYLESERIMDYSLLLGVHLKDGDQDISFPHSNNVDMQTHDVFESNYDPEKGGFLHLEERKRILSNASLRRRRAENLRLEQESSIDPICRATVGQGIQYTAKMLHRSSEKFLQSDYTDAQAVVLYVGIIDILQEYDLSKRLEHAYKSLYFDPLIISAVDPAFYSKRFQKLMHHIFLEIT
ncbi:hypothetical protein KP509_15G036800 [Ceratopteris richardii]|uniref:Phosphatidylinositol 4-phosphate 5-kinase n=1 Tax=Ceratopteris richardii TaxID=49495 RepID=A0A8T2T4K8_CERRI|nr:hypothetical protein KP509_15G036800 [Ceratopteris richardii]